MPVFITHNKWKKGKPINRNDKGVKKMARGKSFEHKKKGHPGAFAQKGEDYQHSEKKIADEEYIVVQEAFKNRVEEE